MFQQQSRDFPTSAHHKDIVTGDLLIGEKIDSVHSA